MEQQGLFVSAMDDAVVPMLARTANHAVRWIQTRWCSSRPDKKHGVHGTASVDGTFD